VFRPGWLEHLDNRIIRPPASYSSYDAERKEATVEHRKRLSRFNTTRSRQHRRFRPFPRKTHSFRLSLIGCLLSWLHSPPSIPVPARPPPTVLRGSQGRLVRPAPLVIATVRPDVTLTGPTSVASVLPTPTHSCGRFRQRRTGCRRLGGYVYGRNWHKVLSGEIVHNSPSTAHSWTFSWNAPTVTATQAPRCSGRG